jgi:carboxypeptidase C (cathepsin A)
MFDLPDGARANITNTRYEGGHMFYLNPPDLAKTRADLVNFIQAGNP